MFNLSVLHVWFKTWMESPCMFNLSVLHVWFTTLDRITLYVQIVCSSCLVENFWMESPCMFNLSVLHVWFKTFVLNHPVCSTCQYLMSGTKLLDQITLYVQLVCSSCLIPNFWIESSCMFNLSVLVWFKTFGWNHPLCSTCQYFMSGSKLLDGITLYIQLVWFKTWMESPCMFNLSGSKLSDWINLYVQFVSTSYLAQNFWMESPCMFKLSILHVLFKTFGWNHPVCSNYLFFMSGSKLLDGNTLYVQLVYLISGSKILDWITLYV